MKEETSVTVCEEVSVEVRGRSSVFVLVITFK